MPVGILLLADRIEVCRCATLEKRTYLGDEITVMARELRVESPHAGRGRKSVGAIDAH